jgi:hypothetical protein
MPYATSDAGIKVYEKESTGLALKATITYTAPWGRIWRAGEYMTFQTNATSSAATCTVGVHYLQS